MANRRLISTFLALMAAFMFGCGDKADEGTDNDGGCGEHTGHDHDGHDHGDDEGHDHDDGHDDGHDHGDDDGHDHDDDDASKIATALKGLGEADQKLARAQKVCPVTDEKLGSMGTPIKVTAGEHTAFLCCEGCRKKFVKSPEKYMKKLNG